jgi:hypothetical protein
MFGVKAAASRVGRRVTARCQKKNPETKCKLQTAQWKGTMKYLINLERIQGIDRLYVWIISARLAGRLAARGA